ncbi:MAG: hypothetical protein JNJ61_19765 [Anaerolineae bacterium]|nr:hypothetical protein [Anaerolineae bacterium]
MAAVVVFMATMSQNANSAVVAVVLVLVFVGMPVLYSLGTLIINPLIRRQWRSVGMGLLVTGGFVIGGLILIDIVPKFIASIGPLILPAIVIFFIIGNMIKGSPKLGWDAAQRHEEEGEANTKKPN